MKSSHLPHRFLLASAALATMGLAVSASADTYTLINTSGTASAPAEFSDLNNWTVGGVTATTLPGTGDTITWGGGAWIYPYIALDDDYSVGSLTESFRRPHWVKSASAAADVVTLTFVTQLGGGAYQNYFVHQGVKMVIAAGATLRGATSDALQSEVTIQDGGEVDILGAVNSRHIKWMVKNGGTLYFAPTSYTQTSDSGSINDNFNIDNSASSIVFPNGLTVTGGNSNWANQFNHNSGTVTFGGSFTSSTAWTYTWKDGTLAITDDSTFAANIALVVPASKSVTLDIASGKTFAAPGLSADSTSSITVTGGGMFSIAPTTAPIILQNGSLGLATAGTYDLSNVSVGSGAATITLTALGARVNSLPAALANATFAANLSSVQAGTVVFQSADSSVLAKVKSDLTVSVPQGFELVASGETLSLEEVSDYIFNSTTTRNLLDPTGWNTGSVPPDGAEVAISGVGVIADYSSGTIPAWTSVEVKNGAILRMNADADLPLIALNKEASLEISTGTTFLTNGLSAIATASVVPDLVVAEGTTLKVPGDMNFKNVDITLEGTLSRTSAGKLTFGYADSGEVTYIGLHATAAKIPDVIRWSYDGCRIGICCPASGGTVHAIDTIVFKDMPTSGTYLPMQGDSYWNGLSIGINNPTNVDVKVVFDNTSWTVNGKLLVAGGGTFRLENGSFFGNTDHETLWDRAVNITEMGKVVVASGSTLRVNALGNWGGGTSTVSAGYKGHEAIVVEDGGIYETYRTSGNNNAVLAVSNGTYRVYRPSIYHDNNGSIYNNQNIPFNGLSSIALAENGVLTFTTRNGSYFTDASGPRVVTFANVPFTGAGSLTLSNANVNAFGVVVRSGANTATGTAGVTPSEEGMGDTALYFASGANWAGTVLANESIGLTNLTDAAAPAAVSFGGVELLDDTFKLRLWENGTCDSIAIGANGWTGTGKLDFDFVGGFEPSGSEVWTIGSQPAGTALPSTAKSYYLLSTTPSATEGIVNICLKMPKGTTILLR